MVESYFKGDGGSHPEDRILEKESVLMILPSVSMERKEGAQGCRGGRVRAETGRQSLLDRGDLPHLFDLCHLVKLQEVVGVVLDDQHVVLLS